jgi:MFS superfamily sulfate permease-like transporter
MFGILDQITLPNFGVLQQWIAWKWILMFFIIGTLESILSAKAIDSIDPWKRKTDMNRDVLAVGCANLCASMVGGLPMISEIVRSKANIDNGARTRFADMWHGIFLLVCVALLPATLHLIPKSALAAMLIYTGFRLAHPSEFSHMYQVGREQLVIFVTTLVVTLATDLLIGVAAGIGMKFLIHLVNGVPIKSFFKAYLDIEPVSQDTVKIRASESAVFSNWIPFKRQIEHIGLVQRKNLIIDVSDAKLIDHTVMEKLHETQAEMQAEGLKFDIVGLDQHQALSGHAEAARKRGLARLRRITVVAEPACEELLQRECLARGASGFTVTPSRGVGRHNVHDGTWETTTGIRLETIVPFQVSEGLLRYLREEVMNKYHPTVSVETIEVLLPDQFLQADTTESALVHHG